MILLRVFPSGPPKDEFIFALFQSNPNVPAIPVTAIELPIAIALLILLKYLTSL